MIESNPIPLARGLFERSVPIPHGRDRIDVEGDGSAWTGKLHFTDMNCIAEEHQLVSGAFG